MIRFFRKYQKTVFGILIFFAAALLLSSFGINMAYDKGSNKDKPAVAINDVHISHAEFEQKKRAVEAQYRRMFGKQYQQLIQQFGMNISQNVLDSLVDNTLLISAARAKDFAAPEDAVLESIQKQFPGGYSPEALYASGTTPDKFYHDTEDQVIIEQITKLLEQSSIPSKKEVQDRYAENESAYDVEYIAVDPAPFEKTIATPSDEELQKFYDTNKSVYQTKPTVSFNFVEFNPEQFFSSVEVPQEEVEFYYTDNTKEFTVPDSAKVHQIQLLFPKDADPKKLAEVREKAQDVLKRAKAGENFEALAKANSDDAGTKLNGGDIGWVTRGKFGKAFDAKVFPGSKTSGVLDLIESDTGFQIVAVDDFKESTTKTLDEVKDDIIKKLKSEQAPAIADAAAREFYDAFLSSEKSLEEFAKEKDLKVTKQTAPLTETQDATGMAPGITKKIMENLPEVKQFVEDKKSSFIVEVSDSKEAQIPDLVAVKGDVVKAVTKQNAITAAHAVADKLLASIKAGKSFADAASENQQKIESIKGAKKGDKKGVLTASEELQKAALTVSDTYPTVPSSVITANNRFYIVRTTARKIPDFTAAKAEDVEKIRSELKEEKTSEARKLLLEQLKKKAKIEIDQSILR